MQEDFDKWIRSNADWITQSERDFALRVWQARQVEIDALKAEVISRENIIAGLNRQLNRLKNEAEQVWEDAERYKWLCDQDEDAYIQILQVGNWVKPAMCVALTFQDGKEQVDAAIDAAMQGRR